MIWNSRLRFAVAILAIGIFLGQASAQQENVPLRNQVYEFLDRMGVKGILPLYSSTSLPLSRHEVAGLLMDVKQKVDRLSIAERSFLDKFQREFIHEIDPQNEQQPGLFNEGGGIRFFDDTEKYLYTFQDSTATLYAEILGSFEYRGTRNSDHSANASLETHGFRLRGTIKERLGYYFQATNGTLYGDKSFALSDPRLRSNVKFNDLNSPYFDFTEAYLRADLSWFNLQFGREFTRIGPGYSGTLLLSDNAPVFDFLKLDASYKSLRFIFLHGSLLGDSAVFTTPVESQESNKYFALHRLEFSLFDRLRLGASEMVIYQRFSPEFAYLNPLIFMKSAEHSLRDRDNTSLSFDLELFPMNGYKVYGSWFIDDIDFGKLGTGWWGNEFAWQGGIAIAGFAGMCDVDAVIEYTRIEPYVYSNRIHNNNFTHNNMQLGHHLEPNSDEWFMQIGYRPSSKLRTWFTLARQRHGVNVIENGMVVRNVGGNVLHGHRASDAETVSFLDGDLSREYRLGVRANYEPFANFMLIGDYELRDILSSSGKMTEHFTSLRLQLEY